MLPHHSTQQQNNETYDTVTRPTLTKSYHSGAGTPTSTLGGSYTGRVQLILRIINKTKQQKQKQNKNLGMTPTARRQREVGRQTHTNHPTTTMVLTSQVW